MEQTLKSWDVCGKSWKCWTYGNLRWKRQKCDQSGANPCHTTNTTTFPTTPEPDYSVIAFHLLLSNKLRYASRILMRCQCLSMSMSNKRWGETSADSKKSYWIKTAIGLLYLVPMYDLQTPSEARSIRCSTGQPLYCRIKSFYANMSHLTWPTILCALLHRCTMSINYIPQNTQWRV